MKVTSVCEREFIRNCISKREKRLDGRPLQKGRTLEITFGQEWGCCLVMLGNTRVFCRVSAEVTEPKAVTPTEGALHINQELSAMSAPDVNISRSSNEAVEASRSLERCIRDSKCIDLESLCIVAGSKVWTIRVDIHALNNDGNLLECASIAAISALAHFKRPDVTVVGTEVTVHSLDDREPVPLNLHHKYIAVNLALFEQGNQILVDPTESEERVADGCYVIGMTAHKEICFIHRRGVLLLSVNTIQKCEEVAIRRAEAITQMIRKALDDDAYKRATKVPVGYVNMLRTGSILGCKHPIYDFDLNEVQKQGANVESSTTKEVEMVVDEDDVSPRTFAVGVSRAKERALHILKESEAGTVFEGGPSKWGVEDDDEDEDTSSDEVESSARASTTIVKEELDMSSEEETGFIESDQVDIKPTTASRGWYSKNPFS